MLSSLVMLMGETSKNRVPVIQRLYDEYTLPRAIISLHTEGAFHIIIQWVFLWKRLYLVDISSSQAWSLPESVSYLCKRVILPRFVWGKLSNYTAA